MKLFRFGEAGKEKPGVMIGGEMVDVSTFGEDFGETFFENDGLRRLALWMEDKKSSLPKVPKNVRMGAPSRGPPRLCV